MADGTVSREMVLGVVTRSGAVGVDFDDEMNGGGDDTALWIPDD